MDFDMKYLMLASDGDERMQRFWEMHENHVPVPILFVPGSRLRKPGFCWAPDSIFAGEETGTDMEHLGSITPCTQLQIPTLGSLSPPKSLTLKFQAFRAFLLGSPKEAVTISIPLIWRDENTSLKDVHMEQVLIYRTYISIPDKTWR